MLKALSLAHGEGAEITTVKFLHPKPTEASKALMAAYFHRAQLFGWFGSQTDSTLNVLSGIVQKSPGSAFPLNDIKQYFQDRRQARIDLTPSDLSDARLRPLLLNIVYSQSFGESPFDVSFKGNEPHIDHIYPQFMLRSKLGLGSQAINDIGNLRFVGAVDNIRKRAELPASYFGRLRSSGVPINRHLLVAWFTDDPSRLKFDAATYADFSARRRDEIWRLLQAALGAQSTVVGV